MILTRVWDWNDKGRAVFRYAIGALVQMENGGLTSLSSASESRKSAIAGGSGDAGQGGEGREVAAVAPTTANFTRPVATEAPWRL